MRISTQLRYYRNNKEAINERRRYNWKHFNRWSLAKQKAWRDKNRDRVRKVNNAWAKENNAKIKAMKQENELLKNALDLALEMRFSDDCPLDNLDVIVGCGVNGDKCQSNGKKCWGIYFRKLANKK